MYSPLTPLSFLERTAATFPDRIAVADEERRLTWAELRERVRRLAVALRSAGLEQGDRVAYPAPVLVMLTSDPVARPLDRPVLVTTAGAPPPAVIERTEALGFAINHVYGLTETYGPISICDWNPDWDALERSARARLKARQGVNLVTAEPLRVVDPGPNDVPRDGETIGEVVMRGNNVMKGYHGDEAATAEAFRGGWFHSGDLGVMHPDGYVELRDRAKDIIISGGENISTIEVERALVAHPDVLEAAVIAVQDEKWGERPKTSTGKVKKYELRERERRSRA